MINNLELRVRMRKIIRPNLQVLLVIALISALPGLLGNVIIVLTGSDPWSYLAARIDTSATFDQITEVLESYLAERGGVLAISGLLQVTLTPVLTLGLINAILTLLRGGTAVVGTAFSRMNAFLRAIGVSLLVYVKIFLWSLPAVPLMALAFFLLLQTANFTLYSAILSLSTALMTALMLMAVYRYAMAPFFLADEPESGVISCVRQSKAVMKTRKMQLFSLEVPYMAGNWLLGSVISTLMGGAIGLALSMMVQLIFSVYIYGARCAFFEAHTRPGGGRAHAYQADPYHDEMKDSLR